jgi:hypothetical protein
VGAIWKALARRAAILRIPSLVTVGELIWLWLCKKVWVEIVVNIKKFKFKIDNTNLNQNFKNH